MPSLLREVLGDVLRQARITQGRTLRQVSDAARVSLGYLSEVEHRWEGDRLVFSGKAKGMKANGTVDITDNEVIIDGKLPLLAKPFEPRIKSQIEKEAGEIFRA